MASHHFADGQIHPGHSRARCPSAANEHARNAPADPAQPAHTTPRHPQPRRMDLCRLPRLRQHRPPATRVGTKPSHRPGLGVRKPLQTLPRQTRRATRDTLTPRFLDRQLVSSPPRSSREKRPSRQYRQLRHTFAKLALETPSDLLALEAPRALVTQRDEQRLRALREGDAPT